jgi:two-component system alkaline phosphatase synthesis response regulator PhoP
MEKELIFVLEDEDHIQQLIKYNLEASGYRVSLFQNGEDLLKEIETSPRPDLFMLDIMLPGIDGLEVCRKIRKDKRAGNTPIIMLTAKSEEFDKVLGLELGADDYITKPFSVRELSARVKALLRRVNIATHEGSNEKVIKHKDICIYTDRHEVYKNDIINNINSLKTYENFKMKG